MTVIPPAATLYVYDATTGRRMHEQKIAVRQSSWDYFLSPRWSRNRRWLMGLSREKDGCQIVLWDAITNAVQALPGPRVMPPMDSAIDWVELPLK